MKLSPRRLVFGMSIWPPNFFSGIRVRSFAEDWTSAEVTLSVNVFTRNWVKVAFGGSLSAMTDPYFFMLVMQQLGPDYVVWDTRGEIDFKKPGRGVLSARFEVPPSVIETMRAETADGAPHRHTFETDIIDADGEVVAHVARQVYVRRKKRTLS